MTNGAEVVVRVIWKPLPTLMRPLRSVELGTHEPREAHVERSDVTVLPAAAVVAEAALAFELARAALEKFGGDAVDDLVGRPPRLPRAHRPGMIPGPYRNLALIGFMGAGKTTAAGVAGRASWAGRRSTPTPRSSRRRASRSRRSSPTTARRRSASSRSGSSMTCCSGSTPWSRSAAGRSRRR